MATLNFGLTFGICSQKFGKSIIEILFTLLSCFIHINLDFVHFAESSIFNCHSISGWTHLQPIKSNTTIKFLWKSLGWITPHCNTSSAVYFLGMYCFSCILSISLFLSFLHRLRQFQADLKVITLSDLSQVNFCSIQHITPSHTNTRCHPCSLSVRSVSPPPSSSLPLPRLLKATCQFSNLTFHLPIPLLLSPILFNLNMTRVRSKSRQVASE